MRADAVDATYEIDRFDRIDKFDKFDKNEKNDNTMTRDEASTQRPQ